MHACTSAWTEEEKMAWLLQEHNAHTPPTQQAHGTANHEALLSLVLVATIEVSVSSLYFSEEHTGSEMQYSILRATRQAQGTEETSATMWCKSHNPILEEDTGGNCT